LTPMFTVTATGFSKPHGGLESIWLHRLNRLLVQAHSQESHDLHSHRVSLRIDNKRMTQTSLVLCLPCLFSVLGLGAKTNLGAETSSPTW
jgi:hypothetical protein